MDLIIDANILFAALIKEGKTIELLFNEDTHLFAPEFLLVEFTNHKEEILKKTKRTEEEFNDILEILKNIIAIIPKEEFEEFLKEAETISQDKNDVQYIALALKLRLPIWSNDKDLKQQNKIIIYHTHDLIKIFNSF